MKYLILLAYLGFVAPAYAGPPTPVPLSQAIAKHGPVVKPHPAKSPWVAALIAALNKTSQHADEKALTKTLKPAKPDLLDLLYRQMLLKTHPIPRQPEVFTLPQVREPTEIHCTTTENGQEGQMAHSYQTHCQTSGGGHE